MAGDASTTARCPNCARLERRIAELEQRVAQLEQLLEKCQRIHILGVLLIKERTPAEMILNITLIKEALVFQTQLVEANHMRTCRRIMLWRIL